ncbi:hypothetical protein [Streptomyces sp. DvalAA-19]|uniref:hypothetical protein n=1 Tax=Streptomyces sp. DvalAA-19 TaxID=1839761 RepID=UPI00081B80D4|nr:hypothetical protein [Streptomyces sp. DvalAA-19]SCE21515.1 hypothetical protein GA0115244_120111 [Streptomyces sp. DvalAA-19]
MIWSSEDLARDLVRRSSTGGLTLAQVTEAVSEAAVRERETLEELRSPSSRVQEPFGWDPEELAERWAARHAEWRRILALMQASGWGTYEPERDTEGTLWAQEREDRRAQFLARHAAHREQVSDGLRADVWLSARAGRLIRALAARTGLTPDQVVTQITENAVLSDDGTVSVPPFTPR